MDDLLGQRLGSYQIIEQIGAGAMATVYKGYHPTMERYVAIKVLPDRLARDATFRARFLREARTIARLEHRYILPIYDFGEDHGVHYLVMRYINGGTLGNLMDARTLSLEWAVQLLSQFGVVHPTRKPSNTRRNTAVILSLLAIAVMTTIGFLVLNSNTTASSIPTATERAGSPMTLAPVAMATINPPPTLVPPLVPPIALPTLIPPTALPTPKPPIITFLRTLRDGADWLPSVTFSPDGQTLAVGSFGKVVQLWGVPDGTLLRTLKGHAHWVWNVAFSPDSQLVASASEDSTVKLWRVSDGTLLHTLTGHVGTVSSVAFAPDGTMIASAAKDQTIKIWRVAGDC